MLKVVVSGGRPSLPRLACRFRSPVAIAVLLAGLAPSGLALAQAATALSPQDIQELRAELKAIKAESDAARTQEAAREQQINAIQRRLDIAAGVKPTQEAAQPPQVQLLQQPQEMSDRAAEEEAPPPVAPNKIFEVSGFAQLDYIQDINRVDPDWEATLRPSKIPTIPGAFGSNGQSIISVRQSHLTLQANQPDVGGNDLYIKFDFDLFGVGAQAGQTTFRLQNFYGKWGPLLVGRTDTLFMDGDIFPNIIDYWGPPGMVYLRDPQIRLTYKKGPNEFAVAIEEPSNDVDPGNLREIDPSLGGVQGDEKIPNFTARYRYDGGWGHVQVAGLLRSVGFDTLGTPDNKPSGSELGWGVNLTANFNLTKNSVIHVGGVYGNGIASYMNDGGVDLAPAGQVLVPTSVHAEAVPLFGVMAYFDHKWNEHFSSSIGYSQTQVTNSSLQLPDAFQVGRYASVNLLWRPDPHIMMGAEYLWGQREDKDSATGDDNRVQFSFKYSFSSKDFYN